MLLTLEEIGLELLMVAAVAGSIACLVFLIRASWMEWRGSRREVDRQSRPVTIVAPRGQAPHPASVSPTSHLVAAPMILDALYVTLILAAFAAAIAYARASSRL